MTGKKEVFIYGGLHGDQELLSDMWAFHPIRDTWRRVEYKPGPEPSPSFGASSIVLSDGTFLIHGGQAFHFYPLNETFAFNPTTGEWAEHKLFVETGERRPEHMPQDVYRWGASFIALPQIWWNRVLPRSALYPTPMDVILMIGGDGATSHNDIVVFWRHKNTPTKWTLRTINQGFKGMSGRRRHGCALFNDEFVFVFGGRHLPTRDMLPTADFFLNDLWVYSISANMWVEIRPTVQKDMLKLFFASAARGVAQLPSRRDELVSTQRALAMAIHGQYHVKGGDEAKDNVAWPERRTGLFATMLGDKFIIATGFWFSVDKDKQKAFNDVWEFSLRTCEWHEVSSNRNFALGAREAQNDEAGECVGPYPHSMSAITQLPHIPTAFFLHGGRLGDYALDDAFILTLEKPPKVTLLQTLCRHLQRETFQGKITQEFIRLDQRNAQAPSGARTSKTLTHNVVRRLVAETVEEMQSLLPLHRRVHGHVLDAQSTTTSTTSPVEG